MGHVSSGCGRRSALAFIVALLVGFGASSAWADPPAERLAESTTVLREILNAPDQGIPDDLLRSAHCLVIVPGVKNAGFVIGATYGRGFVLCRKEGRSGWGAPAAIRIEGGSVGFQIGASETDVVMLVMDERSVDGILSSKFTLGGTAAVAAGPVGRSTTAQTDATFQAKILSYSRSRGAFAGVALSGATLREDSDENKELYGRDVSNKAIVSGEVASPAAATDLVALLNRYSQPQG
jgi:lipid-binding SYLF domain-containing protein